MRTIHTFSLLLLLPLSAACSVAAGGDPNAGAGGQDDVSASQGNGSGDTATTGGGAGATRGAAGAGGATSATSGGDSSGDGSGTSGASGSGGAGGSSSSSTSSGSSSSTSSGSTSSSSATGGGAAATTWTELYAQVFGPTGTSNCSKNGGCHTTSQSGFKCGTSKNACYNGMVSSGLVSPGADAPASVLVDPQSSPLCGTLGGNMPKSGSCVTGEQLTMIKSWLANGAQND